MIVAADHVNLRVRDLGRSIAFYGDLLGLEVTPIPGMEDVPGRWLRDRAGQPVLHIGEAGLADVGEVAVHADDAGTGAVHHVAFDCADYAGTSVALDRAGLETRLNEVPAVNLRQIFVHDPTAC